MKNKISRIFVILSLLFLIAAIAVFSACVDETPEDKPPVEKDKAPVEYDERFGPYVVDVRSFVSNFAEKIDTLEQMSAFVDEMTVEGEIYNGQVVLPGELPTEVLDKIATFDEEYFQQKSVIAVGRLHTGMGYTYYYQDMQVDGSVLTITLINPYDPNAFYPTSVTPLLFLIEVDKATVDGVTDINVVVQTINC